MNWLNPLTFYFLDEPSNDLDLETVDWLKSKIQEIRQTVIFISHDEEFLSQTADTIIHLRLVKHRKEAETLVEHLDYDRYSEQRKAHLPDKSSKLPTTNVPMKKQWKSIVESSKT